MTSTAGHGPVDANSMAASRRMQAVITNEAVIRVAPKSKLKLILPCNSTQNILWSCCPLHALCSIDCFHSFWNISCLLARKEDEELHHFLPHNVVEHYFLLSEEILDVRCAACDDCNATFGSFKKIFPLALRLNCCFHFLTGVCTIGVSI